MQPLLDLTQNRRETIVDNAYQWVPFYETLADKLLSYSDKRSELFELIKKVTSEQPLMKYLHFEREDWWGPRNHQIDPFSIIGVMNRGTTDANRTVLAKVLAGTFDLQLSTPTQWAGIPVMDNRKSFFAGPDEVWDLFTLAMEAAKTNIFSDDFKKAFEKAISVNGNGLAYITMGLYWIRPNVFMPLDGNSRTFVSAHYGITAPSGSCTGDEYVKFLESLKKELSKQNSEISFPELSYTAWNERGTDILPKSEAGTASGKNEVQSIVTAPTDRSTKFAKNIILCGTPGTGKTYSTVLYAVSIIEEKPINAVKAEDYAAVFNRYLKYKDDGLVAFTTFHQSFGYEEFIEGIRPVVSSEENAESGREIEYEVHDGIFKSFCNSAIYGKASSNEENFEKAWDALISTTKQNGNKYIFTRQTGSQIQTQLVSDTVFRVNWQSEQNAHNDLTMTTIVKQWLSVIDRSSLSGGSRWLYDARQAVIDELNKKYGLKYIEQQSFKRNRVFIIDEINRGNISKIFGELITLLEPSKRIGAKEQLRAILPYSGQNFGVPDNVYLIGTMNTADRSIALIDTALRRRFSFIEMQPESSTLTDVLVDGIDISEMLDTLNKRITVLLDREHTIGHSYLLPLKVDPTIENLSEIFENTIVPLLQEYFYDDYEKIQLVLGDNQKPDDSTRFVIKKTDAVKLFGNADIDFPEYYEINRAAFKRIDAYAFL